MTLVLRVLLTLVFVVALSTPSFGQRDSARINLDVKEFRLNNGMMFLVVERHTTPQVACHLSIRAGSALEEAGKTGIAHMLEHMMFKGTKNFGTRDPLKDQVLQDQIEAAYQVILSEETKRKPDRSLIQAKQQEMERLRREVQSLYVPQAFSSQLGKNGAVHVNAFTSKDETQYFMSVPSDMVEQWFSIVSEQLFEPAWREFYVEKEVVQREWAFRYVNNPDGAAWLDLHATAYTAHPYRNPTIGWKSDMERFNTKDAMRFHNAFYRPTNAVAVLVGDISLEKAKQLAEIYFERYPAGKPAPESVTQEPPQSGPRKSVRFLKGARTPNVLIGFHGARMGTREFDALDALSMVLSHGRGARMTQEIVNKGLAVEAWALNLDNRYAGMLIVGGSPNEPEELKKENLGDEEQRQANLRACEHLEKLLMAELERLKTEPVTLRELERIKKLNYRDTMERFRTNESLAMALATTEVQVGWPYLLSYLDRIDKVTPQDIQEVANRFAREDNKTTVFVIPGGKPEKPPETYEEVRSLSGSSARMDFKPKDFTNHSNYPTPPGWRHPLSFERKPHKVVYERADVSTVEGVPVFYLPDPSLPLVNVTLFFKAGSVDVSDEKLGLTQILNDTLIPGGAGERSPRELAMVLDESAIRLSFSVNEEDTVIKLSVLKGDWDKGLALLLDILNRPRFEETVVQASKDQFLTALKRRGEDARAVSRLEAMIWHFKGHVYGRDPFGALATVPGLTKDDLADFLKRYLVPSNMVIAVAGDIEKTVTLESLARLVRSLPGGRSPERNLAEPRKTGPVLALVHKPGQVQSQVSLVLRSVRRTHPDFWKLSLLANLFGGGDSLLYTRLREDLGLVYAAFFTESYKWMAGTLQGYIGCKADKTSEALEETVKIMNSLHREVPASELEQKRMDVLNSFVFNVDTPAELAEAYGRYQLRGEPLDTLDRIQEAFIRVSQEELEALSGKFLDPRLLQIIVVADKTTPVNRTGGKGISLEDDLKALAKKLDLPYTELPLR